MKKSIFNISAALAMALIAGGCADDTFDEIKGISEDREMTLNLRLPAFSTPSTRAVDENAITDLRIFFLDSSGATIGEQDLPDEGDLTKEDGESNKYKASVLVPSGTTNLRLIANYSANNLSEENAEEVTLAEVNPNDASNLIFSGEKSIGEVLSQPNISIDLYRTCAKTTFTLGADVPADFSIVRYHFFGNAESAKIYHTSTTSPTLPDGLTYSATDVVLTPTQAEAFYHYEAEAGNCYWVAETRKGTFYKIGYIEMPEDSGEVTDANNAEELDIMRNHRYDFTITGVNSDGYATLEAAKNAPAFDNRLSIDLKDHAESIFDLIACKDYYLGVSEPAPAASNPDANQQYVYTHFTFITNNKEFLAATDAKKLEAIDWNSLPDWIITENDGYFPSIKALTTDDLTDGTEFQVTFKLDANTSGDDRVAEIPVRVGDLERIVTFTQLGQDFFDGEHGISVALVTTDAYLLNKYQFTDQSLFPSEFYNNCVNYFQFLTAADGLLGETEEEMGVERGNGLHFQVYAKDDASQFKYWIPVDAGATFEISGGSSSNFKVESKTSANGKRYLEVSCQNSVATDNYRLWTGELKVKAAAGEVTYKVYHTGIIHYLNGDYQTPDPDGNITKGWFYYEQVDVAATNGETYHILDRNIGASCNKSYSPASTFNRANTAARGAYFYVPGANKISEVEKAVLPAGFNSLPGIYHFNYMNLKIYNGAEGSYGWDTKNSLLARIYLPGAGSMDGYTLIDQYRANIWSSSIVTGNQGFYEGDKEYGYWYRMLDVYGSSIDARRTVRITNEATKEYHGIPMRAMSCPPAEPGWELPDLPEGRYRIILNNEAGWAKAKANNADMTKGDAEGTWFYINLAEKPSTVQFSGNGTTTATFTVTFDANGTATFTNSGYEVEIPDPIRVYVNLVGVSFVPRIYYDGSEGVSWEGRVNMTAVEGQSNWYYHDISGDATKIKITDQDTGYSYGDKSLSDSDVSNCKNTHVLVLTYNNNWSVTGTTTPSFGGGGGGDDTTTKTYRLYWSKNVGGTDMQYLYAWNGPSTWNASTSNPYEKQGFINSGNTSECYIDFDVPKDETFTIECLVRGEAGCNNGQSKDITVQSSQFQLGTNGRYQYTVYPEKK